MATITLPPEPNIHPPAGGNTILGLIDVNGRSFSPQLAGADENSRVPGRQGVAVPTPSTTWHNMFFVGQCHENVGSGSFPAVPARQRHGRSTPISGPPTRANLPSDPSPAGRMTTCSLTQ